MLDRLGDRKIGHARLDHGDAIIEIDRADTMELGHSQQDAVAERQRAAGERGPRPSRHNLDPFAVTITKDGGDLFGRFRQHDHHRNLAIRGQPIALEWPHRLRGGDDTLARHNAPERRHDLGPASQHRAVELRHCDSHPKLSGVCAKSR